MKCKQLDKTRVQHYGRCPDCGLRHWHSTRMALGKIDAYNLKWKMRKDEMRTKHHDDLLQPIDSKGRKDERFYKLYGDPTAKRNI